MRIPAVLFGMKIRKLRISVSMALILLPQFGFLPISAGRYLEMLCIAQMRSGFFASGKSIIVF
jgi:hypothetical protein